MIVFGQALIRHIRDSTDERWQCKVDGQKTMPRMRHVFEFVQCNSINLYAAIVSTLFFHFLFFVVYLSTRDLPAENAHARFRSGWIRLMTRARTCIWIIEMHCICMHFASEIYRFISLWTFETKVFGMQKQTHSKCVGTDCAARFQ